MHRRSEHHIHELDFHFCYTVDPTTMAMAFSRGLDILGDGLDVSKWHSWISLEDRPTYDKAFQDVVADGGSRRLEYGVNIPGVGACKVLDQIGLASRPGKWPVVVGGVSRSDGVNAMLAQAERHILLGRLATGMVHDFRNIVSGVQNILEWCVRQCEPETELGRSLAKTVAYIDQARSLVNGVLSVSAGRSRGDAPERLDIAKVVFSLDELLRRLLTSGTTLEIHAATETPAVWASRASIQDLVLNLVTNARDAVKGVRNPKVVIKIGPGTLKDGTVCAVLTVSDTGKGMDTEELERIFDAFYSSKPTGLGLGLWMVREAARACGGEVGATATKGVGACFEVRLPCASIIHKETETVFQVEDESIPQVQSNSLDGLFALLVEDDVLIREGLSARLSAEGASVHCAADGREALEHLSNCATRFDFVLQDFTVPGLCGVDLLSAMLAMRPGVAVVVMSGSTDESDAVAALAQGAAAYLAKPFNFEELLACVSAFRGSSSKGI